MTETPKAEKERKNGFEKTLSEFFKEEIKVSRETLIVLGLSLVTLTALITHSCENRNRLLQEGIRKQCPETRPYAPENQPYTPPAPPERPKYST